MRPKGAIGVTRPAFGGSAIASLLGAALLSSAPAARAYRPFDGTDADVAGVGELELELGPAQYLATPDAKYLVVPATVLNLGFAHGWELVGDFRNVWAIHPVEGEPRDRLLDTDLLVKHVWRRGSVQKRSGISVATELGPLLPEAGGDHGFGLIGNLILSQAWDAAWLHLNVQPGLSRTHQFEFFGSVIVEGPHDWTVRPVGEVAYQREGYGPALGSLLLGAIARVEDELAVDAALRLMRRDGRNGLEIRAGFTWALPVWHHAEPEIHD